MVNLEILNKEQQEAVKAQGPVLCIAGAGSGKTTTLTYRVAYLLQNGVTPETILLLTFTKKSATDMLDKLKKLSISNSELIESGTFHHFASKMISRYSGVLGIKGKYSVIDDNDSEDIISSLKKSHFYGKELIPNNKHRLWQIISKARDSETALKDFLLNCSTNIRCDIKAIEDLVIRYNNYKKQNNLLDYDDLLEQLLLLLNNDTIRNEITRQYRYIMVDEYQDTNLIQAKITYLLGKSHKNIMVVGDDAQSIYSFRGARITNIKDFTELFPDSKIVKLEKNYRSYGNILAGCNSLISHSRECIKKNLYTDKIQGNKIALVRCMSENEEAVFVCKRILQLYKTGYKLSDIAVLFRNASFSYCLEIELAKRSIPYKKSGGPKVFEAEHIRNFLAYLRVIANPYEKISWLRILTQIEGIGVHTSSKIYDKCSQQLEPFDFSSIKVSNDKKAHLSLLSKLLINCSNINIKLQEIFNFVFDYYLPLVKYKYPDSYQQKIKDLDQIVIISRKYDKLNSFLSDLLLENQNETSSYMKDFVTLSTIHSSKGLEWKQVFITSLLEGRFPNFSKKQKPSELEEERRLMYVAMTRAKEGLTLTYPSGIWDKQCQSILTEPSRYISEISKGCMEIWQIKH